MAHSVHGDVPLLHGFQKGGLGTGGGPVQLVRQKQIGNHRAGLIAQRPGLPIRDTVARDIRGQHIRGELYPAVLQIQRSGKSQRHGGFAHPGNILQQNMAPGQNGGQHPHKGNVLAHHRPTHLIQDLLYHQRHFVFPGLHPNAPSH